MTALALAQSVGGPRKSLRVGSTEARTGLLDLPSLPGKKTTSGRASTSSKAGSAVLDPDDRFQTEAELYRAIVIADLIAHGFRVLKVALAQPGDHELVDTYVIEEELGK